jgi:hypothetical protein
MHIIVIFHLLFHHHSKRAALCVVTPYTIQRLLCVMNGCYCDTGTKQRPLWPSQTIQASQANIHWLLCCLEHSGLIILHPYCLRMWVGYDGVQVTAQQRYGCQSPLYPLFYCVLCGIVLCR